MSGKDDKPDRNERMASDRVDFQYRAMLRLLGVCPVAINEREWVIGKEYWEALQLPPELETVILSKTDGTVSYSIFSSALRRYWRSMPVRDGLQRRLREVASLGDVDAFDFENEAGAYVRLWDALTVDELERVSDLTKVAQALHRRRRDKT